MGSPERWSVESRLPGGMQSGASLVIDRATGVRAVLKWINVDADDAATVVDHARSCGYPTPAWLDHGTTDDGRSWCVQELVDGVPMGNLDVSGAHLIVQLVSMQRTITPPTARSWPALLREDELVHSDLNVQNILLTPAGAVAGVIDFDEAARGCAVLDLLGPAVNAVIWHSDPAGIEVLHRFAFESYDDASIAAAATIVAREVGGWYRRSIPERWDEISTSIDRWRRSLPD